MKTTLFSLLSAAVLTPAAVAQTIVSDNFDSYTPGVLANGAAWPGAIPGTTPAQSWTTNSGGPQSIVSGAALGRSGNVYHYQENASGQVTTYSEISLGATSGLEEWRVSVDFRLEEITPVSSSFFNILSLGAPGITSTSNQLVRLGVSRRSAAADGDLVFAYEYHNPNSTTVPNPTGYKYSSDSDGQRISLNTWYTLTITGNKNDGTFIISVDGNDLSFTTDPLLYRSGINDFSVIAIGDTAANGWPATGNRSNSVYLDNFRLAAIPEPSTLALLPVALGLFGAARLLRRRSQS